MPYWKALRYGKDGSRQLGCGCTSSICQGILKSVNLLHKQGFVDSQMKTTVYDEKILRGFILNFRVYCVLSPLSKRGKRVVKK